MKILNHDQFEYLFDRGKIVVALVDWASVQPQLDGTVGLGEDGEEGTYVVRALLPLAPDSAPGRKEPVAVVLSDPHIEPWGAAVSLFDPGLASLGAE